MSKDETVERVARAIYEGRYASQGGVWAYVETKDVWHDMARAALSAMPSRELLRDALEALEPFAAQTRASGPTEERNIRRARAAADKIRAALTEPT